MSKKIIGFTLLVCSLIIMLGGYQVKAVGINRFDQQIIQQQGKLEDIYKDDFNKIKTTNIQSIEKMNSQENSPNEQLYFDIYSALDSLKDEIDVSKYSSDSNKIFSIRQKVLDDYPEIFYFTHEGSYYYTNGILKFKYLYAKEDITDMRSKLKVKVDGIIQGIVKDGMTEIEEELAFHDYLVLNTQYDEENYNAGTIPKEDHTAYNVLINGTGVCDGYAKSMKLLLNRVGIECLIVQNYTMSHAWNIVKIDGEYYHLDVTWDDPIPDRKNKISYKYFNLSNNVMNFDHEWTTSDYPSCESEKYSFFKDMYIGVKDGKYIYYSNNKDYYKLYKIKLDGTEKQKIMEDRVGEFVVFQNIIYYSNYSFGGYLFKIDTNGDNNSNIKDYFCKDLYINNGYLYYTNNYEKQESIKLSLREDLNSDGTVNEDDLMILTTHYGKSVGQSEFDIDKDINNDGIIDIFDLVILSKGIN